MAKVEILKPRPHWRDLSSLRGMPEPSLCSWQIVYGVYYSRGAKLLVWPDEGDFDANGKWQFNGEHSTGAYRGTEPLMLDIQTANVLVAIHKSLTREKTIADFEVYLAKSRAHFGHLSTKCWEQVNKCRHG
jgi:hypothetical protein